MFAKKNHKNIFCAENMGGWGGSRKKDFDQFEK